DDIEDVSSDDEIKADENKVDAEVAKEQAGIELAKEESPYGNQFINENLDVSINDILKYITEIQIQSMVDVPIHQEDLVVQRTPLVDTVILMVTENSTPTPTPAPTKAQVTTVSEPDPSPIVLQRLLELEKKVEVLSKVDHAEAIEEFVQAKVINEVKNQLPKLLPKAVSDFVHPIMERTVCDKSGSFQEHLKAFGSIQCFDRFVPSKVLKKRHHDDKDKDHTADSEEKKKRK
ncbi:hypothetical protein Tco_1573122, partial [Tanacetum coccineum]